MIDYCLTPSEQFILTISWRSPICIKPIRLVVLIYSASSLKPQSAGWNNSQLSWFQTNRSLLLYSLMQRDYWRSNKCQFYSLWFDPTTSKKIILDQIWNWSKSNIKKRTKFVLIKFVHYTIIACHINLSRVTRNKWYINFG